MRPPEKGATTERLEKKGRHKFLVTGGSYVYRLIFAQMHRWPEKVRGKELKVPPHDHASKTQKPRGEIL